ncbi:MAG: hypothetical protein UX26_C0013G0012 [Parcubacteria group bacterium GW2011_GWC1_45_9]|nr:MAG: hypothetical protein UW85_C0001G0015 [Parcubacteria group bacterium GW2011_GWA1_Parcubacteria_45_10]KKU16897.1 MAG: hypothetical protein UX26_C0013G0012 [Parcubacteria group bacterium GW2011_GWC1_45_9]
MYFHSSFESLAEQNQSFRKEVFTGSSAQIVLMSLLPNEDIGEEVHTDVDQILFITDGSGKAFIDGSELELKENDILYIQRGAKHNVVNTSSEKMKLVSIYAPAEHPKGTVHQTKADALDAKH